MDHQSKSDGFEPVSKDDPESLYDLLARTPNFANTPGRTTTSAVETTDKDRDPIYW